MKRETKYKDLVLRFLKEKASILAEYSNTLYILSDDFVEIEQNWTEEDCEKVINYLGEFFSDEAVCPWCLIHDFCYYLISESSNHSNGCKYGERHTICSHEESDYKKIIKDIQLHNPSHSLIIDIPAIQKLVEKIRKESNEI